MSRAAILPSTTLRNARPLRQWTRRAFRLAMLWAVACAVPAWAAPAEACGPSGLADRVLVDGALETVRAALLDGLTSAHERGDAFYARYGFTSLDQSGRPFLQAALGATVDKPHFAERWFRDPAHTHDIYVHFMGQTVRSSGWCSHGVPTETGVTYVLKLRADEPMRTEITVEIDASRAPVGKSFNVHAMGRVVEFAPSDPAPADRYRMLVYAAHLAGAELPPIEQPTTSQ